MWSTYDIYLLVYVVCSHSVLYIICSIIITLSVVASGAATTQNSDYTGYSQAGDATQYENVNYQQDHSLGTSGFASQSLGVYQKTKA